LRFWIGVWSLVSWFMVCGSWLGFVVCGLRCGVWGLQKDPLTHLSFSSASRSFYFPSLRPFIRRALLHLVAIQRPAIRHTRFGPTGRKRTLAAKRSMLLLMSCGSKVCTSLLRLMVRMDAMGRMLSSAECVLRCDTVRGDGWLLPSNLPSLRVFVVETTGGCVESLTPRSRKGRGKMTGRRSRGRLVI
jgi:hypothetical protein